jgi:hypothetical protein
VTLRELFWRPLIVLTGLVIAIVPRAHRFRALALAARITDRVAGGIVLRYGAYFPQALGTRAEVIFRLFLRAATRVGVAFDAAVRIDGPSPRPRTIYITCHFPLIGLFVRALHDGGLQPLVVRVSSAPESYWGTRAQSEGVRPTALTLLQIREAVARGRTVVLPIDTASSERTMTVQTTGGTLHIATPIFRLAAQIGAPLHLVIVRGDGAVPRISVHAVTRPEEVAALITAEVATMPGLSFPPA